MLRVSCVIYWLPPTLLGSLVELVLKQLELVLKHLITSQSRAFFVSNSFPIRVVSPTQTSLFYISYKLKYVSPSPFLCSYICAHLSVLIYLCSYICAHISVNYHAALKAHLCMSTAILTPIMMRMWSSGQYFANMKLFDWSKFVYRTQKANVSISHNKYSINKLQRRKFRTLKQKTWNSIANLSNKNT